MEGELSGRGEMRRRRLQVHLLNIKQAALCAQRDRAVDWNIVWSSFAGVRGKLRRQRTGSEAEIGAWKREIDAARGAPGQRRRAAGHRCQWTSDVDVVEISVDLRRAAACYGDARISVRLAIENISREVVELKLAICRDDLCE